MTDENNAINALYAGIEAARANKSDTTEDSSTPPGRIAKLETELKAIIQMYEAKEKHNLWLAIQLSEASEHIAELDAIIAKLKTAIIEFESIIAEYEHKEEHHTAAVRRVGELTDQLEQLYETKETKEVPMPNENNAINALHAGIKTARAKENSSDKLKAKLETELKAKEKHNLWLAIQLSEAIKCIIEFESIIAKYEHRVEHHAAAVRRVGELTDQLKHAEQAIAHHLAANQQLGPALDTAREQVTRLTKQLEAKEIEIK